MGLLKKSIRFSKLKQTIKKSGIYYFYFNLKEQYWKRIMARDMVYATQKLYKKNLHQDLDLVHPELFNEKIQYLKLNDYLDNPLVTQLADKYEVRQYIQDKGLGFLLNDILGLYDSVEDLDWTQLPRQCAIKCTFGAGRNIIITDKELVDERNVKRLLKRYLRVSFGYSSVQPHYLSMPKRYLVEKYIGTESGEYPVDYKIFCMNGIPKFVEVCLSRKTVMQPVFFDVDWNYLDIASSKVELSEAKAQAMRPDTFDQMLEYAQVLSKEFKFVRVDFFEYKKKTFFSELTFIPAAGMSKTMTLEGQKMLGDALEIGI